MFFAFTRPPQDLPRNLCINILSADKTDHVYQLRLRVQTAGFLTGHKIKRVDLIPVELISMLFVKITNLRQRGFIATTEPETLAEIIIESRNIGKDPKHDLCKQRIRRIAMLAKDLFYSLFAPKQMRDVFLGILVGIDIPYKVIF